MKNQNYVIPSLSWFPKQYDNKANFLFSFGQKPSTKTKSPCHPQQQAQVVNSQLIQDSKKKRKTEGNKQGIQVGGGPFDLDTKRYNK